MNRRGRYTTDDGFERLVATIAQRRSYGQTLREIHDDLDDVDEELFYLAWHAATIVLRDND